MIKLLEALAVILIIAEIITAIIVEGALPLLGLVFLQVIMLADFGEDDDL